MNQYSKQQPQPITLKSLTNIHNQLLQLMQQNTNLRMKYPQSPQKFYQTEEDMNNMLQDLSELGQQHLPIIVESQLFIPLIKIINHPNLDLSLQVTQILYNLYQQQPQNDKLFEIYYRFSLWLVQNSLVQGLVTILTLKLDQQNNIQQYESGLKILKLLQILLNLHEQIVSTILSQDKQFFQYLSNRIMPNFIIKHKIIDDNKYISSDLLVNVLSSSQKAQYMFSQFSGIQVLLQTISYYETNLPTNPDEKEFLNNLFSCVEILLINFMVKQNKVTYHEMKGNYLMISFIRKKNQYSSMALKVMSNSLTSLTKQQQTNVVHNIINDSGLKYLFAIFKRKGFRGEDIDEQKAIDQNTLNILYCMIRSSTQIHKDRIQYKLSENRYQNLQRFFELRAQYEQAIRGREKQQQQQQQKSPQQQQTFNAQQYLTNLSQGLSFIQIVDKTLLVLLSSYSRLKTKLRNLFTIYNIKYDQIQQTITNHYQYLGNEEQKKFVESLLGNNLLLLKRLLMDKEEGMIGKDVNEQGKQIIVKVKNEEEM